MGLISPQDIDLRTGGGAVGCRKNSFLGLLPEKLFGGCQRAERKTAFLELFGVRGFVGASSGLRRGFVGASSGLRRGFVGSWVAKIFKREMYLPVGGFRAATFGRAGNNAQNT